MTEGNKSVKPIIAVGGVVIGEGGAVLIRRGQEPLRGRWTIPGGRVECGEFLTETLVREMLEETGLAVQPGGLIEVVESILRNARGEIEHHYVIHDFLCSLIGGQLRAGGDAAEIALVPESALGDYELTESAERVIRKAFALRRAQ